MTPPDIIEGSVPSSPTGLSATARSDIQWAIGQFTALRNDYALARDYYKGKHRLAFASEKLGSAFGKLFRAFADNLMPTVVETVKDRLKLDGFDLKAEQARVDEIWRRNRLKVRTNQVHLDALIEGDAYVIIWPDAEGIPVFYPNRATAIVIDYDDEQPGYITKAAKTWIDADNKCRLTLYYRNKIEKYVTRNKIEGSGLPERAEAFVPFSVAGESWPVENPYDKVPVFHFNNRGSIGSLGCSEMTEAMPVQDALNKSVADLLVASEFYGVPQRWAVGLEDDLTVAQAKERYKLVSGGVWGTTSKDAEFGEFSAGDISKYIDIKEGFKKDIAVVSRTPLHYFQLTGTPPSGESLRVAEAPLVKKAKDKIDLFGAVWSDAMRFALQIAGVGDHEPEPKWDSPETRDDDAEVNRAATKHRELQVPIETLWTELGYTDKQIAEMQALRLSEQAEQLKRQQEMMKAKGIVAPKPANGDSEVLQ